MVMQTIEGCDVYVVDLDQDVITGAASGEHPITGLTEGEAKYEEIIDYLVGPFGARPALIPRRDTGTYAKALDDAIKDGMITEPGKYGIHIWYDAKQGGRYEIFAIVEDELHKV